MSIYLSDSSKSRINALAKRLKTHVPAYIDIAAWPLPLLEVLTNKIEELEAKVAQLEREKTGD